MLVLSRVPVEALLIGEEIEVRVLRVFRGEVRFGLTAPHHVAILRSELLDRHADHPSRNPKHKSLPPADEALRCKAVTAVEDSTRK